MNSSIFEPLQKHLRVTICRQWIPLDTGTGVVPDVWRYFSHNKLHHSRNASNWVTVFPSRKLNRNIDELCIFALANIKLETLCFALKRLLAPLPRINT